MAGGEVGLADMGFDTGTGLHDTQDAVAKMQLYIIIGCLGNGGSCGQAPALGAQNRHLGAWKRRAHEAAYTPSAEARSAACQPYMLVLSGFIPKV